MFQFFIIFYFEYFQNLWRNFSVFIDNVITSAYLPVDAYKLCLLCFL